MKKFYFIFCSFILFAVGNIAAQETTVHSVTDTAFVSSTAEYQILMTTVSEVGKTTVSIEIKPLASDLGQIYDVNISRDTDARLSGRGRFMTSVKPDAQGRIVAEDAHASWDASNVGTGTYPTGTPLFYSVTINRTTENGGTARGKRSIPAIYLGKEPDYAANESINNGQLMLNTLAWVNKADSTVLLRLGFAGENDMLTYQQLLLAKVTPLYPAGDSPIYIKNTWFNNSSSTTGRTDAGYGNIYWGNEGVTYAKIKVNPNWVDNAGNTYIWFSLGYPSTSTVIPIEVNMGFTSTAIAKISMNNCKVFPTITKDLVHFESNSNIRAISVVNILGQNVYSNTGNLSEKFTLDMSKKPSGLYNIFVKFDKEEVVYKVIKK
ncbi:MAG: T9SS type A sorting domain-containing protein [Paludibacter sp.]|nr:T9SS type A sorting domain-containing protein [Paludibacter sp.]